MNQLGLSFIMLYVVQPVMKMQKRVPPSPSLTPHGLNFLLIQMAC